MQPPRFGNVVCVVWYGVCLVSLVGCVCAWSLVLWLLHRGATNRRSTHVYGRMCCAFAIPAETHT